MVDLKDLGFISSENSAQKPINNMFDDVFESQQQKMDDLVRNTPPHPPNPGNETNEKLEDLQLTIKDGVSESSKSSNYWNRVMLFVSLIALATSALFSILSFNSSNEASVRLQKLISEQNQLLRANIERNKEIQSNPVKKALEMNNLLNKKTQNR
ncbi:hypothetical protein [Psychromonas sp. L1A2]|uniref:hypothetical protein n=1 Tax=Psychromonas sp. L1A2 TaxID=2686356 RepID=UPI001357E12D|nr:hypothetical protein [Psychromonas sp. L1A2]